MSHSPVTCCPSAANQMMQSCVPWLAKPLEHTGPQPQVVHCFSTDTAGKHGEEWIPEFCQNLIKICAIKHVKWLWFCCYCSFTCLSFTVTHTCIFLIYQMKHEIVYECCWVSTEISAAFVLLQSKAGAESQLFHRCTEVTLPLLHSVCNAKRCLGVRGFPLLE